MHQMAQKLPKNPKRSKVANMHSYAESKISLRFGLHFLSHSHFETRVLNDARVTLNTKESNVALIHVRTAESQIETS